MEDGRPLGAGAEREEDEMADEHGDGRAPGTDDDALRAGAADASGAGAIRTDRKGRRTWRWVAAGVLAVALVIGLTLTQPWKLFVNVTVDEAAPVTASTTTRAPSAPTSSAAPTSDPDASGGVPPTTATAPPNAPDAPPVGGSFVSHAHGTTGTVQVLTTEGGATVVRLEDLATDNGPDLKVYLSANPADSGEIGGGALSLGDLKGNRGNQNYEVPAGTDLSSFRSVVIWCERFTVAFGAAPLT